MGVYLQVTVVLEADRLCNKQEKIGDPVSSAVRSGGSGAFWRHAVNTSM